MPTELVVLDSAAQTRQKSYIAIFACFLNISSSSQLKAFSQPLLKVKETSYCSAVMYVMMGVRETRPRLQTGRPVHTRVSQKTQKSEFCFATNPTGFHIWHIWPYLAYFGAYLGARNMVKWGVPEKILQNAVQTRWS